MADTTNMQAQAPATQQDQGSASDDTAPRKLYATREDAEKEKPAKAGKHAKVYEVTKAGAAMGFIWGNGYADCATWAARKEGYAFSLGTKAVVTKDAVAAALAGMSDADRLALIAQYLPAPTPTPAPTPKGKGKN